MNCSYVLNKKKDKRFAGTQQAVARKEIADAVAAAAAAVLLSLYPSNEDAQRRKTGSLPALPGCMASFHLLLLFPRSLAVKWTNLLKQASIYSKYIYTVYIYMYIYTAIGSRIEFHGQRAGGKFFHSLDILLLYLLFLGWPVIYSDR